MSRTISFLNFYKKLFIWKRKKSKKIRKYDKTSAFSQICFHCQLKFRCARPITKFFFKKINLMCLVVNFFTFIFPAKQALQALTTNTRNCSKWVCVHEITGGVRSHVPFMAPKSFPLYFIIMSPSKLWNVHYSQSYTSPPFNEKKQH